MLREFIKPENIILNLESEDKEIVFAEMVENAIASRPSLRRDEVYQAVMERESKFNTCIAKGIAVPHANCSSNLEKSVIIIGISPQGIDYETQDKSPVHIVVMLLFEQGNAQKHLKLLADCARVISSKKFYSSVMQAKTADEICKIIEVIENEA